jgi:hypothetical protein
MQLKMARSTSLYLPALVRKLHLLYAHSELKTGEQLSAQLGVSKATLSGYVNGGKDKEAGFVPEAPRLKLAEIVSRASDGRLSVARAEALLLGHFDAFARALAKPAARSLESVLAANANRLEVEVGIVDFDGLAILDEPPIVPHRSVIVRPRQGVYFEVGSLRRGNCLTAVIETTKGWTPFVPGRHHPGILRKSRERIPHDLATHLRFKPDRGIDRFIFFETKTSEPLMPFEPARVAPLQPFELERFVDSLSDVQQVPAWRWGEAYIVIDDP